MLRFTHPGSTTVRSENGPLDVEDAPFVSLQSHLVANELASAPRLKDIFHILIFGLEFVSSLVIINAPFSGRPTAMQNTILTSAWILIAIGMLCLLVVIPLLSWLFKKSDARTEFLSTRASYWCVMSGLILLAVAALSLAVENVAAVLARK